MCHMREYMPQTPPQRTHNTYQRTHTGTQKSALKYKFLYTYGRCSVRLRIGKIVKKHPRKLKQPRTQFFVFGFGISQVN